MSRPGAIASAGLRSSGDLTMALTSDGAGATPAALIGSLHESGSVTLKAAQFSGPGSRGIGGGAAGRRSKRLRST